MKSVFDLKTRKFREAKKHEEYNAVEFPGGGGGVVYLDLKKGSQAGRYTCGHTFEEVQAMIEEGKVVYVRLNSEVYTLAKNNGIEMWFTSIVASQGNVECAFANFSRDTGEFYCGYNTLMGGIS